MPGYKAGTLISNKLLGGGGDATVWEAVDLVGAAAGPLAKGISAGLNGGSKTVLWTSGTGNDAAMVASELGTAIADTLIGGALNKLGTFVPRMVWDEASRIFVSNATGVVNVVAGGPMYAASTFSRIELGAAIANQNIQKIVVMRLY